MTLEITYKDTVTFYKPVSTGYRGTKVSTEQQDVPATFLQNTGITQSRFQTLANSDAVCYPDFTNSFIIDNANRLEGMYLTAKLFGVDESKSWYKVVSVNVNRDHLLGNNIDNIELLLDKVSPLNEEEIS